MHFVFRGYLCGGTLHQALLQKASDKWENVLTKFPVRSSEKAPSVKESGDVATEFFQVASEVGTGLPLGEEYRNGKSRSYIA